MTSDGMRQAIDYLDKNWPKGKSKMRGEAMVLMALAQIAGREEGKIIREGTMKLYKITLIGCDDNTSINIRLNKSQIEIIKDISERTKQESTYGCMPVMYVDEIEEDVFCEVSE